MSFVISALFIWLGFFSFLLFFISIYFSYKWDYKSPLLDYLADGTISSICLVLVGCVSWTSRKDKSYGYFAFGLIVLMTGGWFYYLLFTLKYPKIHLSIKENDTFPIDISSFQKETGDKTPSEAFSSALYSLVFYIPNLNDMFILHTVKRMLFQKDKFDFNLTILSNEPLSDTPFLSEIQEKATILTSDEFANLLISGNQDALTVKNVPLLFLLSPEKEIKWLLIPTEKRSLLFFDSKIPLDLQEVLYTS